MGKFGIVMLAAACLSIATAAPSAARSSRLADQNVPNYKVGKSCTTSDGRDGTWHRICARHGSGGSGFGGRHCLMHRVVCQEANHLH